MYHPMKNLLLMDQLDLMELQSKLQIFQEAGHGAYASARGDFRECLLEFLDENSIYKQG